MLAGDIVRSTQNSSTIVIFKCVTLTFFGIRPGRMWEPHVYTVYTRVHNALSGELAAGQPGELFVGLTGMSGMPDIIVIDLITNHCCD